MRKARVLDVCRRRQVVHSVILGAGCRHEQECIRTGRYGQPTRAENPRAGTRQINFHAVSNLLRYSYPFFVIRESTNRYAEYVAGAVTKTHSRSRPRRLGLNQFGWKRNWPPSMTNGSSYWLPPSSQANASMGRGCAL